MNRIREIFRIQSRFAILFVVALAGCHSESATNETSSVTASTRGTGQNSQVTDDLELGFQLTNVAILCVCGEELVKNSCEESKAIVEAEGGAAQVLCIDQLSNEELLATIAKDASVVILDGHGVVNSEGAYCFGGSLGSKCLIPNKDINTLIEKAFDDCTIIINSCHSGGYQCPPNWKSPVVRFCQSDRSITFPASSQSMTQVILPQVVKDPMLPEFRGDICEITTLNAASTPTPLPEFADACSKSDGTLADPVLSISTMVSCTISYSCHDKDFDLTQEFTRTVSLTLSESVTTAGGIDIAHYEVCIRLEAPRDVGMCKQTDIKIQTLETRTRKLCCLNARGNTFQNSDGTIGTVEKIH